jgi:hypothetical protein
MQDPYQKVPLTPGTPFYPNTYMNAEFLSDPESCRNSGSTRHRKSSSYESHESAARPLHSTTRETTRWSVASASSMPDLMHSRSKSKMMLAKSVISAPLESLPQSPPYEKDPPLEDSTIVPRELRTQPARSSFVMRRPQTPSDRAILQHAGRSAQERGSRTSPPNRSMYAPPEGAKGRHEVPGWI